MTYSLKGNGKMDFLKKKFQLNPKKTRGKHEGVGRGLEENKQKTTQPKNRKRMIKMVDLNQMISIMT